MKTTILLFVFATLSTVASGQASSVILSGGWANAIPDNSSTTVNGFKIGAQFEKRMSTGHWALGVAFTYLSMDKKYSSGLISEWTAKYRAMPIVFHGKYMIGTAKLQGYIKASGGFQLSTVKLVTSVGDEVSSDFGITVGTGAGAYYHLSEKIFLNLDYDFLYLTNSWIENGITNAVTLGVGIKVN